MIAHYSTFCQETVDFKNQSTTNEPLRKINKRKKQLYTNATHTKLLFNLFTDITHAKSSAQPTTPNFIHALPQNHLYRNSHVFDMSYIRKLQTIFLHLYK